MIIRAALKTLVLPPAASLILAIAALLIWRRWPKLARVSLVLSIASLWILSLPVTGLALMHGLESQYSPVNTAQLDKDTRAIVILGGGRRVSAAEYGVDSVNARTLERLRYGAELHRETQLPILVTGGRVYGDEAVSEAQLMARVLRDEFGVPVRWLEVNSRTTAENAVFTAKLLEQQKINSVLLVTHAWHMPRAAWAFERVGLTVTAGPMAYSSGSAPTRWTAWLPSAQALLRSHYALHEILGGWVYRQTLANSQLSL